MAAATQPDQSVVGGLERRWLGHEPDLAHAVQALADGAVVGHGFANFYVITARADEASVRGVNLMKGRPADQVGSITVPPDDYLYITSANRSRHLTGADDTPAHWRAEGLRAEFADQLYLLEHPDEEAARAAYPGYLPMSTTILGFSTPSEGRPSLMLERHGSLHVDTVRDTLDGLGLDLVIGPKARTRLLLREY